MFRSRMIAAASTTDACLETTYGSLLMTDATVLLMCTSCQRGLPDAYRFGEPGKPRLVLSQHLGVAPRVLGVRRVEAPRRFLRADDRCRREHRRQRAAFHEQLGRSHLHRVRE